MNARRVQVSDFVARGMWGSAGWRGVVRGEVAVQDDRGGAECGGVDTACREPDDDRMHGAEVGQFGHSALDRLLEVVAELSQAWTGERHHIKIK